MLVDDIDYIWNSPAQIITAIVYHICLSALKAQEAFDAYLLN
jgi:hypothetical protein